MMQKLMEINDHLVRTLAECEQLRSDQKTLRKICSIRLQRINELQEELRKACAERDELRKDQTKLQGICADGGRRIDQLKAELDATRKQLRDVCSAQSVESAGQSDLVRDVSHYTEMAETDTPATDDAPAEPKPVQEVTLSAYIVGDKVSPEALRIVWATEEWIQQSQFGIVHSMKDVTFLDQDRFTPEQFSLTLYLKK